MEAVEASNTSLDTCSGCEAVWFDKLELENVRSGDRGLEDLFRDLPRDAPLRFENGALCPKCGSHDLCEGMAYLARAIVCRSCEGFLLSQPAIREIANRAAGRGDGPQRMVDFLCYPIITSILEYVRFLDRRMGH